MTLPPCPQSPGMVFWFLDVQPKCILASKNYQVSMSQIFPTQYLLLVSPEDFACNDFTLSPRSSTGGLSCRIPQNPHLIFELMDLSFKLQQQLKFHRENNCARHHTARLIPDHAQN